MKEKRRHKFGIISISNCFEMNYVKKYALTNYGWFKSGEIGLYPPVQAHTHMHTHPQDDNAWNIKPTRDFINTALFLLCYTPIFGVSLCYDRCYCNRYWNWRYSIKSASVFWAETKTVIKGCIHPDIRFQSDTRLITLVKNVPIPTSVIKWHWMTKWTLTR